MQRFLCSASERSCLRCARKCQCQIFNQKARNTSVSFLGYMPYNYYIAQLVTFTSYEHDPMKEIRQNLTSVHQPMKRHLSWDIFTRHGYVLNCKCPVIRGHLPNADIRRANHKILSSKLTWVVGSLQAVNTHSVLIYAHLVQVIDLAKNLPHK